MIKLMPQNKNCLINVTLKDGTEYLGKDIPQRPIPDNGSIVSFWEDDALITIPMTEVKHIAIYFEPL